MGRLLLIILVLTLVVTVGSKFYYEHKIKETLDQASAAASMAGQLNYDSVEITHEGEVRIEGLSFKPHGALEAATVDLIAVRPGSLVKLFQLEKELRNEQMPVSLGFSVHGVEIPTTEEYEQTHKENSLISNMGLLGCADPATTSFPGLPALGYKSINMKMDLDYTIIGNGEHIEIKANVFADEYSNSEVDLNLRLGAANRNIAAIMMSLQNAELNGLVFKSEDFGYEKRLMEHCAKSAELPLEEYYSHHMQGWQDAWKNRDLQAGENLTNAYRHYIENPKSFELELYPTDSFKLREFAVTQPNILIYHLKGKIKTNKMESMPLDLAAYTGVRPSSINDNVSDLPKREQAEDLSISLDQLRDYLHKPVVITLNNGKTYKGKTKSVSVSRVQLLRNVGGGELLMPLKVKDIAKIEKEE